MSVLLGFVLLDIYLHPFHKALPESHRISRQNFNLYCLKQIIADPGEVDKNPGKSIRTRGSGDCQLTFNDIFFQDIFLVKEVNRFFEQLKQLFPFFFRNTGEVNSEEQIASIFNIF